MPQKRREELAEYVKKENLLVIEDDAYRFLCVDPPSSFLELIPEHTIHIESLSKPVNSFMKTAFIFAPISINEALADWIRYTSSGTSAFNSRLARYILEKDYLSEIVADKRQLAQSSQKILANKFQHIEYKAHPTAFHVWVKLPADKIAKQVVAELADECILVSPGTDFAVGSGGEDFFRMALAGEQDTERLESALTCIATRISV